MNRSDLTSANLPMKTIYPTENALPMLPFIKRMP